MSRRPPVLLTAVLFAAGLAVLTACSKKKSDGGDDTGGGGPPAAVNSEYLLYAHLNVKEILASPLYKEIKDAVAKSGGTAEWDKMEAEAVKEIGVKPTDIETVTACLTEFPGQGEPKAIVILTSGKPIDKSAALGIGQGKPDARGLYTPARAKDAKVHFPDPKTLVILTPSLADKYLAGYGKDRTGWPLTPELSKAAGGHTLFAVVQMGNIPREMLGQQGNQMFAPLLAAQAVTLTGDLRGKELIAAARATFPDAGAAGKAKDTVQGLIGMGANFIEQFMTGKQTPEMAPLMPAVKEAHRALKEAKVEVVGADLTVSGSYKVDFDIGKMVAEGVLKVREAASRMTSQNNLKQIGLALHNFSDVNGGALPVHAVGANGLPLKNPTDKPLLSWRVALLPYIEQGNLYQQFKLNEPWDSEHNKKLIEQMPKIYAPVTKQGKPGYTHLQMVVGTNALNPVGTRMPASFLDGTSNTIAVVEAAEPVIWTKPDDVMFTGKEVPKDLKKKFGGLHPNGFNVVLWDGSVRFVSDSVSERTLGLALNPNDGQALGSDW